MIYYFAQYNGNCTIHFNCCMVFYSIGQFLTAFIDDIRQCLTRLDAEIQFFSKRRQRTSDVHLKQMFHETIIFHTEIKQLRIFRIYQIINFNFYHDNENNFFTSRIGNHFCRAYRPILLVFFTCGLFVWCISLVEFNVVNEAHNFSSLRIYI